MGALRLQPTLVVVIVVLAGCNALTGVDELGVGGGALGSSVDGGGGGPGGKDGGATSSSSGGPDSAGGSDGGSTTGLDSGGGADAPSPDPTKRVFASSTNMTANLGGLTGADAKCNQLAVAASLGGTFVAWLSTNTVNARDRVTGAGPWMLVGQTSVVITKAELTNPPITGPIRRDESGQLVSGLVWTGTDKDGTFLDDDCGDWASASAGEHGATGDTLVVGPAWTAATPGDCNMQRRVYCFQQ